jgi:hypothetical protein
MVESVILIDRSGVVRYVADDDINGTIDPGPVQAARASHVEPKPDGSGYTVDFSPIGVSQDPLPEFRTRQEALAYEVNRLIEMGIPLPLSIR